MVYTYSIKIVIYFAIALALALYCFFGLTCELCHYGRDLALLRV